MPRSLRAQLAIGFGLLLLGGALACWSIATGRQSAGTLAVRTLACLGAYTLAIWARDAVRTIRRARRR